jgi:hypothetical protein
VKGFEGFYEVSDQGRVRSLERQVKKWDGFRTVKARELKPHKKSNGYLDVTLFRENRRFIKGIHCLVAEAFLEKPLGADRVLHNNDIKTDNRLANLRWGTHQENMKDAIRNGRCPKGEEAVWSKLTAEQVLAIRKDPRTQVAIAKDYNVQRTAIQKIKNRESWAWLAEG